ncbi:hypothetical protein GCM10010425_77770 [Streptomyces spororaveus]|uniref:Tetratricopeptide repeat protein n=1 Tax=Streptomyces spororaveus TaxID=284039 RepID=A0ABQ3TQA2_9ACTN|nr:tetratricopeptide repeat protein [Streptomyces spororaveus]GHI82581.1 hypothetical protein Sspor_81420 [Streptomyces spororaveus]
MSPTRCLSLRRRPRPRHIARDRAYQSVLRPGCRSGRHREGTALNNLGIALRETQQFEEAIDAHTQAATTFHELGDRHSEGTALKVWAITHNERWLKRAE